jgi:hypothetical protein
MCLEHILPVDVISQQIQRPLHLSEFSLDEIAQVIEFDPCIIHAASLRIWDRVFTHARLPVDPMMLADEVNLKDPWMFQRISEIIGEPSIRQFYYVRVLVEDASLKYNTAAQFAAANVYPRDLLLIDLLLSNPYKPIPEDERKFHHRKYQGYGLLGQVISNAQQCGRSCGCEAITLTTASFPIVGVLQRHGFIIDDTVSGRRAVRMRLGAPMHLNLVP